MDQDDIRDLYTEKYKKLIGIAFEQWQETGPKTENEAYQRCIELDKELEATYDQWYEAEGDEKEKLEEYREKLKAEYDFIEESFGIEAPDKNW